MSNRILIVDDNPQIHEDIKKVLCPSVNELSEEFTELEAALFGSFEPQKVSVQYEINSAYQGLEACEIMTTAVQENNPYALAFVDMRMPPGIDGLETIKRLWAIDPNLEVIICSAYSDYSWEEIISNLGETEQLLFLSKPFTSVAAQQMALSQVRKWSLKKRLYQHVDILESTLTEQTGYVNLLKKVAIAANQASNINQAIQEIITQVCEYTGWPVGNCYLLDKETAQFKLSGDLYLAETLENKEQLKNTLKESNLQFDIDHLKHGQCLYHTLSSIDNHSNLTTQCNLQTQLRIPVFIEEDLVAILEFYSRSTGKLEQQWLDNLNNIGNQLGRVIERVWKQNELTVNNDLLQKQISEREQLETQLVQAQKLESIGQLAAGIAHEINTPIQYIGDNTLFIQDSFNDLEHLISHFEQLLQTVNLTHSEHTKKVQDTIEEIDLAYLKDEIPQAISQTLDGVKKVSEIVRSMKVLAHPGGKDKTSVDLNQAIETAITVSRNEWKYVADVETNLQADLPPIIGLGGELNQVFLNLLVNASHAVGDRVKAGDFDKGRITFKTSQLNQQYVRVTITDTGTGIPEEIKDKIFNPFFTTKEVGKGTGMGLSIIYSIIVDTHQGNLDFNSEMGKGTTFTLDLPLSTTTQTSSRSILRQQILLPDLAHQ